MYAGRGLVNSLINSLPIELHLPGYQYCGPGTKLQKRLARGDPGINPLDEACKEHDIAYSKHKSVEQRHLADNILQERAWMRVKSKDASIGEKAAAWSVTNIMKGKRKLGMGIRKRKMGHAIVKRIARELKKSGKADAKNALIAARRVVKSIGKKNITVPRVIKIPKQGGILPFLIPLFAGLSAVGALAGGASGIASAVNKSKAAQRELDEGTRHNKMMESIALGKKGQALYIKPYKSGAALYLNKSKNF